MTIDPDARLIAVHDHGTPSVDPTAFVAAGVVLAGNVTIAPGAGVWFNAVLRSDSEPIVIGEGSNIQDNCSGHVDMGFPLTVGRNVSVGHNAVLHGCTVEDNVLIGMHATVMNGAVIGAGSLVAAGALVLEGTVIPPNSLVAGVPAKVRRETTADERADIIENAVHYRERISNYS
jgi:carbonic anhydrase/acetyltransferase-like protein (isoleucine patch superfamily)